MIGMVLDDFGGCIVAWFFNQENIHVAIEERRGEINIDCVRIK